MIKEQYRELFSALPTPTYLTYGNVDVPDFWAPFLRDGHTVLDGQTIDVDGLDPSVMPATARPEPGGLSWYELLAVLRLVNERRTVVGCDVVEFSPLAGMTAPDVLCARLVQKLVAYRFANAGRP